MALLNGIIPPQKFELVRDRLGELLHTELSNQATLTSSDEYDATVWVERMVPFDHTDSPAVNVSMARGSYGNKDATKADGTYEYEIDCYFSAKAKEDPEDETKTVGGDHLSAVKLQRLLGMCRAILENPRYRTLAYTPPFNCSMAVTGLLIFTATGGGDARYVSMGRLTVSVRVPETVELIEAVPIAGYSTTVKLYETEKGYHYGEQEAVEGFETEDGDTVVDEEGQDNLTPE